MGGEGGFSLASYRLCFFVDAWLPTYPSEKVDELQVPPNAERSYCPDGFQGYVVERDDSALGACLRVVHELPEDGSPNRVYVDTSACEVPDSDREGEDPAVFIFDGGVAVCLVPIVEHDDPPDSSLSLEPCEPETVDPEVRFGGGAVRFCIDVHVLGIGSTDVNQVAEYALETASASEDLVYDLTGVNETVDVWPRATP